MAKPFYDARAIRRLGLGIAALVFGLDQAIKALVIRGLDLPGRLSIDILPIFRFMWVGNHGISMGFLTAETPAGRWGLVALTAAIAVAVVYWLWQERNRLDAFALGLVLGGALGNITDRVRTGYVTDFMNLHFGEFSPFLVFNVADAAITIGVLLLVLRALFVRTPASEDLHA